MYLKTRNSATLSFLFVPERGSVPESGQNRDFIPFDSETEICTFQREIFNHNQAKTVLEGLL